MKNVESPFGSLKLLSINHISLGEGKENTFDTAPRRFSKNPSRTAR